MAIKFLKSCLLMSLFFLASFHSVDAGFGVCKRKVLFTKIKFTCPEPGQPSDFVFCCGDDDDLGGQYCCKGLDIGIENIGSIIGTIAGVIGFILLLLIICCCICPCCLLYKKRTSGNVYRSAAVPNTGGPANVNVTIAPAPGATNNAPPIGFAAPNPGYSTQPGYPPQTGYPMQPPTGYPPYPPQPGAAPYPVQPTAYQMPPQTGFYSDQPPPYPGTQEAYQKQSPYNPAY